MNNKVSMMSVALVVNACVISAAPASRQEAVVAVNLEEVFAASKEGRDLQYSMSQRHQQAQQRLVAQQQKLREERERLNKQASLLSTEARIDRERDLARKLRALEREQEDLKQDLEVDARLAVEKVRRKHHDAAQEVFKKRGASLLVDATATLAVNSSVDITKDVVKKVNDDYTKTHEQSKSAAPQKSA